MNVQNKVIVITGGAGGIGSAQAKLLARNGAEVWILDLVQEKIDQLVEELKRQGGKAHGAVADVTSEEEWKTIVCMASATFSLHSTAHTPPRCR